MSDMLKPWWLLTTKDSQDLKGRAPQNASSENSAAKDSASRFTKTLPNLDITLIDLLTVAASSRYRNEACARQPRPR